jgi:hypothetical protein
MSEKFDMKLVIDAVTTPLHVVLALVRREVQRVDEARLDWLDKDVVRTVGIHNPLD